MEEAVQACRESSETVLREGMEKVREILGRKAPPAETAGALLSVREAFGDSPPGRWAAREAERIKAKKG
jgi:hypothetical protein